MRQCLFSAFTLLACVATTQANAAAPAEKSGNETTAEDFAAFSAAREMLIGIGFEKNLEEVMLRMGDMSFSESLAASEREYSITFPDDLRDQLRRLVAETVHEMANELKKTVLDDAAHVYAKYFTAAEIRELQEIQRNPVMAKANKVMPAMQVELASIGVKAAAARQPSIQRQVKDVVERWLEKNRDKVKRS
jgi:sugar-specific transcriptional regulator TrmB